MCSMCLDGFLCAYQLPRLCPWPCTHLLWSRSAMQKQTQHYLCHWQAGSLQRAKDRQGILKTQQPQGPQVSAHTGSDQHLIYFLSLFIYFWEGERQGEGIERGRESQAGFASSVQSPMYGLNSWTVRSWPESKSRVRRLNDWAIQEPWSSFLILFSPNVLLWA